MEKQEILERIKDLGLLAVIRGPSEILTIKIIDALIDGGVLGIEVTFSTPNAYSVVETVNKKYGNEILLGMGTLTRAEQVHEAMIKGAQFLVSPMYDEELVTAMVGSGLVTMVGSLTPTEVSQAHKGGADVIKIFPGRLGGPNFIKDLRGPFPDILFMPTGGVEKDNVAEWFKAGAIAVGVGSNLCPKEIILKEDFEEITRISKEFVKIVNKTKKTCVN